MSYFTRTTGEKELSTGMTPISRSLPAFSSSPGCTGSTSRTPLETWRAYLRFHLLDAAAPFLANVSSVQQGYLGSEPFVIEGAGVKPVVMLLADAGYMSYAALIQTSVKLTNENPSLVQRFVAKPQRLSSPASTRSTFLIRIGMSCSSTGVDGT